MHIQQRKLKIELVRNIYCKEKKRGVTKIIGSFKSWSKPDEDLVNLLSDEEKIKLNKWLDDKKLDEKLSNLNHSLSKRSLSFLTEATEELEITEDQARDLFKMMDSVKKSLRKAGYTHKNIIVDKKTS